MYGRVGPGTVRSEDAPDRPSAGGVRLPRCGEFSTGDPTPGTFDMLTPLIDWVESGRAPGRVADSPISLLGLVAIYEHKKPQTYAEYWWRTTPECGATSLPTAPPDYVPVWRRGRSPADPG